MARLGCVGYLSAYAIIGIALFGLDARTLHKDLNELRSQKNALEESNTKAQQDLKQIIWNAQKELSDSISRAQDDFRGAISSARQETHERVRELDDLLSRTREQTEKRMMELTNFLKEASIQTETPTQQYRDLDEQYQELGATVQEISERTHPQSSPAQPSDGITTRSNIALIREVIGSSQYEWTTIARVERLTGLSADTIMDEVRAAPDIRIGRGKKTREPIFKFKD
jgi:Tfp pilus assembly protein FimV